MTEKNQTVQLDIQDEGLGIPENKLLHIFDKYYRAHDGLQKDAGGSGLGLTVVKHIVEAHQGHLGVKSTVNKGSTFTIVLPGI